MKIVSFNINSIRARPHQIEHLRDTINPDIIGLQETKVNDPEFPMEVINEIGYHAEYWGQKGHYGVAILSKEKPINTVKGFVNDTEDDQKRFIQSELCQRHVTCPVSAIPQFQHARRPSISDTRDDSLLVLLLCDR